MNVCPRCHNDKEELIKSRRNDIQICTMCGNEEALIDWYNANGKPGMIPGEVMLRETHFLNKMFSARSKTEK